MVSSNNNNKQQIKKKSQRYRSSPSPCSLQYYYLLRECIHVYYTSGADYYNVHGKILKKVRDKNRPPRRHYYTHRTYAEGTNAML